jgi:hypothetical protein
MKEESRDDFGMLKSAMLNDPRTGYWPYIVLERDGNQICAHLNEFTNLQECPAGFGDTAKEAVSAFLIDMKRVCGRAMWTGYGAPAGVCGEPAYTSEIHPNSIAMILCKDIGRCPRHGGFDVQAAASLALFYRTPNRADFVDAYLKEQAK